jgi:predicted AAA+ superfamily ATPase
MVERELSKKVLQFAKQYPVVTITGPRQSGKTTLCKMLFPDRAYVSLEDPEQREFAQKDPRGFLSRFRDQVILDEIQRVPDLLSYIQVIVDETNNPGQFIITGSQNFNVMDAVAQSLAGRTAIVTLLPFSYNESSVIRTRFSLENILYTGFYPRIFDKKLNPTEALGFYVNTYIERDIRNLMNVQDLSQFTTFIKLCAGRTGQVLNFTSLGNDCGLSHNTIKKWLSLLETSFIIKLVYPYFKNIQKRLIKAPKIHFLDPGLAAYLLSVQNERELESHPLKGFLFESFVISEFLKTRYNRGETENLYYFRDYKKNEIDLILDYGINIDICEIKVSKTVSSHFFKNLKQFSAGAANVKNSFLIYAGEQEYAREGVEIRNWKNLPGKTG